jgi:translocon-associated protein subunit beta
MNSFKLIALILNILFIQFNFIQSANIDETEGAKILVTKNLLNNYLVEGLDIQIKYNIYNIGNL